MRIFILEDNPDRMIKFRRELVGHTVDHADNVTDGIDLVANNRYDLLFLDHDLGGEEMVDSSNENTGYQLANIIAACSPNKDTFCIVHSCNPAGADKMISSLPHAVKMPFIALDIGSAVKIVQRLLAEPQEFC